MIIWLISCVHVLLLVLFSVSLVEDHCSRMSVLWWMWIRTMGSRATQTAFFKCILETDELYGRHDRVPGYPIIPSPINPAPNTNCNQMMWRIEGWNMMESSMFGFNLLRIQWDSNAQDFLCLQCFHAVLLQGHYWPAHWGLWDGQFPEWIPFEPEKKISKSPAKNKRPQSWFSWYRTYLIFIIFYSACTALLPIRAALRFETDFLLDPI